MTAPGPATMVPTMSRVVVAIDGPAGAGKSTVARRLAARLGYQLLDTGAIYRAVALLARRQGIPWDDEARLAGLAGGLDVGFRLDGELNRVLVNGEDVTAAIRTPEMSQGASRVSALPAVRAALLGLQRRLGAGGGVVAEGRDIGTVVFPDSPAKFFVTASPEVRARRRYQELAAAGQPVDEQATLDEVIERDRRDETRAAAPLKQAADALRIDTSVLTIEQVVETLERAVRERAGSDRY